MTALLPLSKLSNTCNGCVGLAASQTIFFFDTLQMARADDHVVVLGVLEHHKPDAALESKRELTVALGDAALSLREAAKLPADHVQAVCIEGDVRRAAMDAVAEHNADVIVCGTRNHSHLQKLLAGSVAQFLIEHAICPVLVVRGEVLGGESADDDEDEKVAAKVKL